MLSLEELLKRAVEMGAEDIFIVVGSPAACKLKREIVKLDEEMLRPENSEDYIHNIYGLAKRDIERFLKLGDDDFSFALPGLARFRVCTYKQRGSLAAVIRVISFGIPDYKEKNIPDNVMAISAHTKGLVLVTGSAGSGKSTTLACIIDRINSTRAGHIITLEEPIEYLHRNKKSLISQREVELDSENYVTALRACLRQSPDVILVGEMRDHETISTALTAAETGHLVISTLHTVGAANTIDRIIDVFPPAQQQQIRVQLASLLQSVVSQQLLPTVDGGLVPAFEIMHLNNAIRNMIRESKAHQIDSVIATSAAEGMIGMDAYILKLLQDKVITKDTALLFAAAPDLMQKRISLL